MNVRRRNPHILGVENVADYAHIEFEEKRKVGLLQTGNAHSADDRKFD
jgi:hypothetical protein